MIKDLRKARTIRLDEETHRALKQCALDYNTNVQSILIILIDDFLKNKNNFFIGTLKLTKEINHGRL